MKTLVLKDGKTVYADITVFQNAIKIGTSETLYYSPNIGKMWVSGILLADIEGSLEIVPVYQEGRRIEKMVDADIEELQKINLQLVEIKNNLDALEATKVENMLQKLVPNAFSSRAEISVNFVETKTVTKLKYDHIAMRIGTKGCIGAIDTGAFINIVRSIPSNAKFVRNEMITSMSKRDMKAVYEIEISYKDTTRKILAIQGPIPKEIYLTRETARLLGLEIKSFLDGVEIPIDRIPVVIDDATYNAAIDTGADCNILKFQAQSAKHIGIERVSTAHKGTLEQVYSVKCEIIGSAKKTIKFLKGMIPYDVYLSPKTAESFGITIEVHEI